MKITSYWTQSPVFNSNIPNQYSLPSQTFFYFLKWQLCSRQMAQHISWSQDHSMSLHISKSILWTFTSGMNCAWQTVRHCRGHQLKLCKIYYEIERNFICEVIGDWNVIWYILEEDKWVQMILALFRIDDRCDWVSI